MPEFPELKDIVERPQPVVYWPWIVLGAVLLIGFIVIAFLVWRQLTKKPVTINAPALVEATNAALAALKQLHGRVSNLSSDETVIEVQTVLRQYLHRHHGALGLYRTADELIGRTGNQENMPPPNPMLANIEAIFRRCEELRYNKMELPDEEARLGLVDEAIDSIEKEHSKS